MKLSPVLPLLLLWLVLAGPVRAVTFDLWRAEHFSAAELADPAVSSATADPDADGLGNLLEYAWALDPHIADAAAGARLTTHQNAPALDFFRRLDGEYLFSALEISPDLTTGVCATAPASSRAAWGA